jgi:peptidoglycan/xylan/chitin deacetylase (PgdA/CDA1 family)
VHLPGNIRILRTLRRLRSRLRNGVAILGYHRVSDPARDPLGLSTSPENFEAHLRIAAQLGPILPLREAVAAIVAHRLPKRAIVVTFDDGYSDNLHTVLPLLEKHGAAATMFITSGNHGSEFWWDRLARLLAASGRATQAESLASSLEHLPAEEREARLAVLAQEVVRAPEPVYLTLTVAELTRLAASPLIEIGAHTESHRRLTSLSAGAQAEETSRSRTHLETLLARPVTSFAYPHGAINPQAINIVRQAGYRIACCSRGDVAGHGAPLHALPRLWPADRSGPAFERWLRGWLHA